MWCEERSSAAIEPKRMGFAHLQCHLNDIRCHRHSADAIASARRRVKVKILPSMRQHALKYQKRRTARENQEKEHRSAFKLLNQNKFSLKEMANMFFVPNVVHHT